MNVKSRSTLALVSIILLLVSTSLIWKVKGPSLTSEFEAQTSPPAQGSLRWYAEQSTARGEKQIALILSPRIPVAATLNDAMNNFSVAVGELIAQESVWYDPPDSIYTWYKFRLTETLTQKPYVPCDTCTFTPNAPASLLPLQSGEILVALLGGSAMIDNVLIDAIIENFAGVTLGRKYLLFLNLDAVHQRGNLPIGPQGILTVNPDSTFTPVTELGTGETEPISRGLEYQFGNSLSRLRAALSHD